MAGPVTLGPRTGPWPWAWVIPINRASIVSHWSLSVSFLEPKSTTASHPTGSRLPSHVMERWSPQELTWLAERTSRFLSALPLHSLEQYRESARPA